MSAKSFAVFMGVLGVLGLLAYGLLSKSEASLAAGDTAPDAQLPRLNGSGSGRIADYRGRWVLVNFWASWCGPCRDEAPALEEFQRRHGGGEFTVLGINLDDNTDDARAFVERYGLSYPQLRDGDGRDRRDAYGMTGFPESFLVDPRGRLVLLCRGPLTRASLNGEILDSIEGREVRAVHAPCRV
jgi:cytochrome c biogenesis protein CcmG/thiol:disulfide interchange protein DsbE